MSSGNDQYQPARQGSTFSTGRVQKPTKRETNVEFVTRVMEDGQHGVVMQLLIMDILSKGAKRLAETPYEEVEAQFNESGASNFINPLAWHQTAKVLHEEIEGRLK